MVAVVCTAPGIKDLVAKIYIPPDNRDLDDRALERFRTEIALTSKIRHPNIVRSLDDGIVELGTYRLPFYVMPLASNTFRSEIRSDTDADRIERKFRLFARAASGVAFLHNNGIVHRDLKPENILLDQSGSPLVADLGIAHVNPDFVSVGLNTIASERLLNRDYYAPEQRFTDANKVDHRADIYALGCILYELLTSIPPVRANPPPLESISTAFAPLDPVWRRMTDWESGLRYQSVEGALEDAWFAIGLCLAMMRGAAGMRHPDLPSMSALLRSNNHMHRQRGIELAMRLGKAALPELHVLSGHGRREVRNAVATALGRIGDSDSIPFLVGGLYGNADKASRFRPTTDSAADAIALYPDQHRLRALELISQPIRPSQLEAILKGLPKAEAYNAAVYLFESGRVLLDWSEHRMAILVPLDEERAWPEVHAVIEQGGDFEINHIVPTLSPPKQLEAMRQWLSKGPRDSWYFEYQLRLFGELRLANERRELLETLEKKITSYSMKPDRRRELLEKLRTARDQTTPSTVENGLTRAVGDRDSEL
jgi:serine/threonine protein kinase